MTPKHPVTPVAFPSASEFTRIQSPNALHCQWKWGQNGALLTLVLEFAVGGSTRLLVELRQLAAQRVVVRLKSVAPAGVTVCLEHYPWIILVKDKDARYQDVTHVPWCSIEVPQRSRLGSLPVRT